MIRTNWKKCHECGNLVPVLWNSELKMCKNCCQKMNARSSNGFQVRVSAKRVSTMKENKKYYNAAIDMNKFKNRGVCRCDECGKEILKPKGRNVCHIIGMGANPALYHHPKNHVVLGKGRIFGECDCGEKFDEGDKWNMSIYPMTEEVRIELNAEYYKLKNI